MGNQHAIITTATPLSWEALNNSFIDDREQQGLADCIFNAHHHVQSLFPKELMILISDSGEKGNNASLFFSQKNDSFARQKMQASKGRLIKAPLHNSHSLKDNVDVLGEFSHLKYRILFTFSEFFFAFLYFSVMTF